MGSVRSVIGCDVGSQGTNAALYAADGELVASAYEAYDLSFPHPGWAEQDPDLWTAAMETACRRLVAECPGRPVRDPRALVRIAARRHGRVRRGGPPPAPRADLDGPPGRGAGGGPRRADLASGLLPGGRCEPRLVPRGVQGAVGPRRGARHLEGGLAAHVARAPTSSVTRPVSSAVDPSNASSLALLDPRTKTWSPEALDATGIDPAMLPELGDATKAVGTVTADLRRGERARSGDRRRDRLRRRDGGDARRRRLRAGRGVRRRRDRRAGVRGERRAARGPDDARRVSSPRRSGRLAAREPRVRLGRQPPLVARPVRASRSDGTRRKGWGTRTTS